MPPPASRRRALALALVVLLLAPAACSDDDADRDDSSTSSSTASSLPVGVDDDPALAPLVLEAADLPGTFTASEDVADTVTSFCAGQDAAAGLRATGRSLAGYRGEPAGTSVIHVVFRFADDGAATFVRQAEQLLSTCSEVPDVTGLAFAYEPASPEVVDAARGADTSATRYGRSVGSGNLTVNLAVLHRGEVGELVAVLGVDTPRELLDTLAAAALRAAVARLPAIGG